MNRGRYDLIADVASDPFEALCAAVLAQAIDDLRRERLREAAQTWIESPHFKFYCVELGLDAYTLRKRAMEMYD